MVTGRFTFMKEEGFGGQCYGQRITTTDAPSIMQVSAFQVDGVDNVDITKRFHLWFGISLILSMIAFLTKFFSMLAVGTNSTRCF